MERYPYRPVRDVKNKFSTLDRKFLLKAQTLLYLCMIDQNLFLKGHPDE